MKHYIRNIEDLNEFLGYERDEFEGEEIGYGEKAAIFEDVTDLCNGETEEGRLNDFLENADFGTCFQYEDKCICKVRNSNGEGENVFEDSEGNIQQF
jgi:hypothetical protein